MTTDSAGREPASLHQAALNGALPAPPVPAECDLTDFPYMPLLVARLRKSKAWVKARRDPALGFYLINLWTAAWHEVPAGSLEDEDDVLADAAMCDPAIWPQVRAAVLRGWVKCSDGRLYHPVVCERVLESWAIKLERIEKNEHERDRKRVEREERAELFAKLREHGIHKPWNYGLLDLRRAVQELSGGQDKERSRKGSGLSGTSPAPVTARKGKGKGKGNSYSASYEAGADAPPPAVDNSAAPPPGPPVEPPPAPPAPPAPVEPPPAPPPPAAAKSPLPGPPAAPDGLFSAANGPFIPRPQSAFADMTAEIWGVGKDWLAWCGVNHQTAGRLIGKWLRDARSERIVRDAIFSGIEAGTRDPQSFVAKVVGEANKGRGHRAYPGDLRGMSYGESDDFPGVDMRDWDGRP